MTKKKEELQFSPYYPSIGNNMVGKTKQHKGFPSFTC